MIFPVLLARGIKRKVFDALGIELMSDKFNVLAVNYVFLMVYFTLESIYVNTLLLRLSDGDIQAVLAYRAVTFAFSAVGMSLGSIFSHKINSVVAIRTAGGLYVLLFLTMFVGMEHLGSLIFPVGAISGLAVGFYWLGHNVLLTHYTTQHNRAVGIAIMTVIQGALALSMPLVSGIVIGLSPGMAGYRVMFGVAIGAVLAQVAFMRKLSPVSNTQKRGEMLLALRLIWRRLMLRIMIAMEFARGLREGVFIFFLNILLFEIVSSESLVGFNSFLAGSASIAAAWLYGRIAKPDNRMLMTGISATAMLAFCSLLLFALAPVTVILFNVVNAFLAMLIMNCTVNNTFDALGWDDASRGVMTELLAYREVAIACGRIAGVVALSLFPATLQGYVHAMLALIATQYLVVLLMYASRREMVKQEALRDG